VKDKGVAPYDMGDVVLVGFEGAEIAAGATPRVNGSNKPKATRALMLMLAMPASSVNI